MVFDGLVHPIDPPLTTRRSRQANDGWDDRPDTIKGHCLSLVSPTWIVTFLAKARQVLLLVIWMLQSRVKEHYEFDTAYCPFTILQNIVMMPTRWWLFNMRRSRKRTKNTYRVNP